MTSPDNGIGWDDVLWADIHDAVDVFAEDDDDYPHEQEVPD